MKKLSLLFSFIFALCLSFGANAQACAKSCKKSCTKAKTASVKADKVDDTIVASMSLMKDVKNMSHPDYKGMSLEECAKKHGISVEECAKLCAQQCSKNKGTAIASNAKQTLLKNKSLEIPVKAEKKSVQKKAATSM